MELKLNTKIKIPEATLHFSDRGSFVDFKAYLYVLNNSNLSVKHPINFSMAFADNIAKLILGELEKISLESLKDENKDSE